MLESALLHLVKGIVDSPDDVRVESHDSPRGEVLEVRGGSGGPPYLVKWAPDGHTGLFYPAGSCNVVHETARG